MFRRWTTASVSAVRTMSTTAEAVNKVSQSVYTGGGGKDTLGRRLFGLVYAKRSAVVAIQKWKEEGHLVRKFHLNRIVLELRKLKRYRHALEICEWMKLQDNVKLQQGDYAVHLDLIAKVRGLTSAEKFFEDLPVSLRGHPTCSSLLHTYVQNKQSDKAEALMEKMAQCNYLTNSLPYNDMLSLYISEGKFDKVEGVIHELKKNAKPNVVTYNLWLTMCSAQNDVNTAEEVFLELKKAKIVTDWVTYSVLSSLYIKEGLVEKATAALKEMEKRASRKNRQAYSSLISLNTNIGDKDAVIRIWKKIKALFRKMNDSEYTCMISSLVKLDSVQEAEGLYTEWETVSGTGDCRVPNILLAAYIKKQTMETAEEFYNRIVKKGIVPSYTTWELMTWGYLKRKNMLKVIECFKKTVSCIKKWKPDENLINEVYRELEKEHDIHGAEQMLITLRKAGYVNTEIYNCLLRTYAKAGKMPLIVVERMKKDKVELDEETLDLIKLTSKMCVTEIPQDLS